MRNRLLPVVLPALLAAVTSDLAASPERFAAATRVLTVNERPVGADAAPKVISADDGDFVVLFRRNDASGGTLYGRAYRADGTPQPGGEFRIGEARGDETLVDAVSDAKGNFVVAWNRTDAEGSDVFVRSFDGHGLPRLGRETRVNQTTARSQRGASLASAPNGDFVVVWSGDSPGGDGTGVYCRAFQADGTPKSDEQALGLAGTGFDLPFGVGMDARGDFAVGWFERDDVESEGVVATQAFFADGTPKPGGEQRAGGDRPGYVFMGQLDMGPSGDFVVSWQNSVGPRAFFRTYAANGMPKRPNERRLSAIETRHEVNPRIALGDDGGFVAAWQTDGVDGNDTEIYARRFDADGEPAGEPEFVVNATTSGLQDLRQLERVGRDDFAIAWTTAFSDDLEDDGAYVRSFDVDGTPKPSGEQRVAAFSTTTDGGNQPSALLRAPGGGFVIVLGDGLPRFRAFDAKGLPRGPVVRADAGEGFVTAAPSATFDLDGDLVFAWSADTVNVRRFGGAQEVDLAVFARDSGQPVAPGTTFRYLFDVTNLHPVSAQPKVGLADGVRLSVDLPDDASVVEIEAPGWTCRTGDAQVNCAADRALVPGEAASVRLLLRAPTGATSRLSVTASVTADQFDPDEGARDSTNQVREVTPIGEEPSSS